MFKGFKLNTKNLMCLKLINESELGGFSFFILLKLLLLLGGDVLMGIEGQIIDIQQSELTKSTYFRLNQKIKK